MADLTDRPPGVSVQTDWRTNGVPLLTTGSMGSLPTLVVTNGRNRLVIGFGPHEDLEPEHADLADALASEAGALAVEVGRLARGGVTNLGDRTGLEVCAFPPWTIHVHLRPGRTKIKMLPCEGDVPWLDFLVGGEALCSISFDVARVEELGLGHLAIAGELAAGAREFALRVRGVVDVGVSESELET